MTLRDRITNRNEHPEKQKPLSLPLLMCVAESDGDPERTIAALRLLNQYLIRELRENELSHNQTSKCE